MLIRVWTLNYCIVLAHVLDTIGNFHPHWLQMRQMRQMRYIACGYFCCIEGGHRWKGILKYGGGGTFGPCPRPHFLLLGVTRVQSPPSWEPWVGLSWTGLDVSLMFQGKVEGVQQRLTCFVRTTVSFSRMRNVCIKICTEIRSDYHPLLHFTDVITLRLLGFSKGNCSSLKTRWAKRSTVGAWVGINILSAFVFQLIANARSPLWSHIRSDAHAGNNDTA